MIEFTLSYKAWLLAISSTLMGVVEVFSEYTQNKSIIADGFKAPAETIEYLRKLTNREN